MTTNLTDSVNKLEELFKELRAVDLELLKDSTLVATANTDGLKIVSAKELKKTKWKDPNIKPEELIRQENNKKILESYKLIKK